MSQNGQIYSAIQTLIHIIYLWWNVVWMKDTNWWTNCTTKPQQYILQAY